MTLETILATAALIVAAISALTTARVTRANRLLAGKVDSLQSQLREIAATSIPDAREETYALSGLVIAIAITQDHPAAPFARLLRDALHSADADVSIISEEGASQIAALLHSGSTGHAPDVLIRGSITCNGYSDIFYRAGLTFTTRFGELNPLTEQPAQGAPQNSLCLEALSRLTADLPVARLRAERTAALRELRSDINISRT